MHLDIPANLIVLIAQISLGAAAVGVHALAVQRLGRPPGRWNEALTGAVFGVAGALALMIPAELVPGVPATTATACVGLAGLFGGWIGGAVAVAISVTARMALDYPQLGVGAVRAVTAALVGAGVAIWIREVGKKPSTRHLLVQGLLVLVMVSAVQVAMPGAQSLTAVYLPLAIVLPFSTFVLGLQFLTEQHRADLARRLADNERRLRLLIENMPGAVFEMHLGTDGLPVYTFWRSGQLELGGTGDRIGADPAQIATRLLRDEDESRERFYRDSAARMRTGTLENRYERADGSLGWLRTRATPRLDDDGRVVWTGILAEVSDEKRKDEELRRFTAELGQAGRLFSAVMAHLPAMIFEALETPDGQYRYTFVSEGVRMLGLSPQEVIGDPNRIEALYFPEDEPDRQRMMKEARETLSLREREFRVKLADGTVLWLHTRALPHRGRGGVTVWDGITFDITQSKQFQEALHRSERTLTLGGLTEGVAQAFNGLLQEVGMAAGALVPHVQDRAELLARLERIRVLVDRGTKLEEDLVRFSRAQGESRGPVKLKDLLEGVRDMAGNLAGRDIRFTVRANPNLWPAVAEATRLQSAILGLVLHARDTVPRGGEIALTARNVTLREADAQVFKCRAGAYVRVVVADSGSVSGLDTAVPILAAGPGTNDKQAEIDLRLRAVQHFAERSGGHFAQQGAPGQGTMLQLLLPADAPAEPPSRDAPFTLA